MKPGIQQSYQDILDTGQRIMLLWGGFVQYNFVGCMLIAISPIAIWNQIAVWNQMDANQGLGQMQTKLYRMLRWSLELPSSASRGSPKL